MAERIISQLSLVSLNKVKSLWLALDEFSLIDIPSSAFLVCTSEWQPYFQLKLVGSGLGHFRFSIVHSKDEKLFGIGERPSYQPTIEANQLQLYRLLDQMRHGWNEAEEWRFSLSEFEADRHQCRSAQQSITPKKKETRKDQIYFIQSESGHIKIGVSNCVKARLSALQTANPEKLKLLKAIDGSYGKEAELHARFSGFRSSGEWFEPTQELMDFIGAVK